MKDEKLPSDLEETEIEDEVEEQEIEQEAPPKDLRGALRHSIKELSEEGEKEGEKEPPEKPPVEAKKPREPKVQEPKQPDSEKKEQTPAQQQSHEPPPFFRNKGKAVWDKLSAEDQTLLLQREQEISNGFAQMGAKVKEFDSLAPVIAPRLHAINAFGATPAQTIDKLFQWMEALGNQDYASRVNAFRVLASSFGVNVAHISPEYQPDQNAEYANQLHNYLSQFNSKITNMETEMANQRSSSLQNYWTNWSKDKPHFESVRGTMHALLTSGAIPPLANGDLDFEGAYQAAIRANPEVSAQIQRDADAKSKADADAKARKDATDKAARLARARRAGTGLKPATQNMFAEASNQQTPTNRRISVRDSLKQSMEQLAE
jgi:hypothetical protein